MTIVTDCHSAYFALHFLNHQVYLAHLLRELQYLSELDAKQDWSEKVEALLREAIHERNSKSDVVIDRAMWIERLDGLLKENIEKLGEKFNTFRKRFIKCRDYIFNFLGTPAIPPDNDASEREICKLKIKLKNSCTFRSDLENSCTFRSDLGADAFLELHSIVKTAKKHKQTSCYSNLVLRLEHPHATIAE